MMSKKRGYKLRRFYKYYWFYFCREIFFQIVNFIIGVCVIIVLSPYVFFLQYLYAFFKKYFKSMWGLRRCFYKIPPRKLLKEKLIKLKLKTK